MKAFFSTGGLGDSWILYLRILHSVDIREKIIWKHYNAHKCHVQPIKKIQDLLSNAECSSEQIKKSEIKQKEKEFFKEYPNGIRLTTDAKKLINPFFDLKTFAVTTRVFQKNQYCVINMFAGRNDNSARKFTENFVKETAGTKNVILLGPKIDIDSQKLPLNTINMLGKTDLYESLHIIAKASEFIGFDGFLAYAAMSFSIPSQVIFHEYQLIQKYMHPGWEFKTTKYIPKKHFGNQPTIINSMKDIIYHG